MNYLEPGQSGGPFVRSLVRIGRLCRDYIYGLVIILFLSGYAQAQQKEINQQTMAWYRLAERMDVSPAWRLMLEAEYRPFHFTGNRFQYYVRGRVQHPLNEHWRLGLGVAYFRQTNHQA